MSDDEKFGITTFDDEYDVDRKINAWKDIEIGRLKSERDLYLETIRSLKRIDTKMCILVTQTLLKVRDEKG